MRSVIAMLLLATVLAGCSDSSPTPSSLHADGGGNGNPNWLVDGVSFGDGGAMAGVDGATARASDIPATAGACEFAATPDAGQPGAACSDPADCDSGLCVEGPEGKICSRTCIDCCPNGFKCEQWAKTDADFICLPKLAALCRPCKEDAECAAINAGALCVGDADSGAFCGGACAKASDCPAGYACELGKGTQGEGMQCVRKVGACGCSTRSVTEGAATWCSQTNGAGTCKGERKCTVAGLSACDAAAAATESCNGADDDCDGQTDEEIAPKACEIGDGADTCPGEESCVNGAPVCAGQTPGPETCDGLDNDCDGSTDEEFDDLDNDGKADCVDDDSDGDGTANGDDCAPLDKAIHPGAQEICNGKDDNCDGKTDEEGATGCVSFWIDADQDGWGNLGQAKCLCGPSGEYGSEKSGDCDDGVKAIHPQAPELCDGADNDCNGSKDEGFNLGGGCEDGLGSCKAFGSVVCSADGAGVTCSAKAGAGGAEKCNGVDDDCDGKTDESLSQGCSNACGNGTETCSVGKWQGCSAPQPKCTSGSCCDGCNYRPSSYKCGTKADATTYQCSGTCGGSVQRYESWRYCTGSSSSCGTGNVKKQYKAVQQKCGSTQLCANAGNSASCKSCSGGCSSGKCYTQPVRVICIDAGFGGSEPGAKGNGLVEKDLNLSFAKHLQSWLNKDTANGAGGGTWKVVMTRTGDQTLSIPTRAAICNNAGAVRLVSIFTNSFSIASAKGTETYHHGSASAATKDFCLKLHNQVVNQGGNYNRGLKAGNYTILGSAKMPACLTLPGFLSNSADASKLKLDSWRSTVAKGMLYGLQQSFGYSAFTP